MINQIIQKLKDSFLSSETSEFSQPLFHHGLGSTVINFVNKLITLVIGIILVRTLGKSNFGIYSYIFSIIQVLLVPVELGVTNLLVRETSKNLTEASIDLVIGLLHWAIGLVILSSIIIIALSFFFSQSQIFNLSVDELITFYWGLSIIPTSSLLHVFSAFLRGQKFIVLGQIPDLILIPGIFLIVLILYPLFQSNLTHTSAMELRSIATFIAALLSIILLWRKTPKLILKSNPKISNYYWIKSTFPMAVTNGLNLIKNRASILILGLFVSSDEIGIYQVAISSAALAIVFLEIINAVVAPQFASLYSQKAFSKLKRLVNISSKLAFILTLLISFIFIIFGKNLLTYVFGTDLIDAYPTLLILLIGQIISSYFGSVGFLLNMTGHEKEVMKANEISTAINILLAFLLTPTFGSIGTAIATTITVIISNILLNRMVFRKLKIKSQAF
jgi:O-antigen/teichoic acid export membrane protein